MREKPTAKTIYKTSPQRTVPERSLFLYLPYSPLDIEVKLSNLEVQGECIR